MLELFPGVVEQYGGDPTRLPEPVGPLLYEYAARRDLEFKKTVYEAVAEVMKAMS